MAGLLVPRFQGREKRLRLLERAVAIHLEVGKRDRHREIRNDAFALDALAVAQDEADLAVREFRAAGNARVAEEAEEAAAARLADHLGAARRLHGAGVELAAAGAPG